MNMFEWNLYVQLVDTALLFINTQTFEILYISFSLICLSCQTKPKGMLHAHSSCLLLDAY